MSGLDNDGPLINFPHGPMGPFPATSPPHPRHPAPVCSAPPPQARHLIRSHSEVLMISDEAATCSPLPKHARMHACRGPASHR